MISNPFWSNLFSSFITHHFLYQLFPPCFDLKILCNVEKNDHD